MQNDTVNDKSASSKEANTELLRLIAKNDAGKLPWILSIVFGILGIFILGLVFAPLAFFLAIYSLYKKRILLGIIGVILSIIALVTSPSFWWLIILNNEVAVQKENKNIKQAFEKRQEIAVAEAQKHQDSLPSFDQIKFNWNNDINAFCKDVATYSINDIDTLTTEQKDFFFQAKEQFSSKIKEHLWVKTSDGRKINKEQLKTLLFLIKISIKANIKNNILSESRYYIDVVNTSSLHNIISNEWAWDKTSIIWEEKNPNPLTINIEKGLQLIVTKKDWDYYVQ